jgi:hypothetical protein
LVHLIGELLLNLQPVKKESMKSTQKMIFIFLGAIVFASCNGDPKKDGLSANDININGDKSQLPVMEFIETIHDFGRITQGEKVSYRFKFTNTGKSNLIIMSAQGSCGCTVAQPPKEPIPAGKEGGIDVVFNSDGKSGKMDKKVTVVTNCEPNTKILTILADIIVPEDKDPGPVKPK